MTETSELLQRIAAMRKRLEASTAPAVKSAAVDLVHAVEDKVQRGALHNSLIESALKRVDPNEPASAPANRTGNRSGGEKGDAPPVLTARGARLIRKGRALLQDLRAVGADACFEHMDDFDPLACLYREGAATIEVLLRTVQTLPASVSAQVRMCDGLEVVLRDAEDRIALLRTCLTHRKREIVRIDELAAYLRALAGRQSVNLTPLQAFADTIVEEARAGIPLKFLSASAQDPARFAAAHGITVAQVLARLLHGEAEWGQQLQLAVMAGLVHDIGMTRVPADVLAAPGPLDDDQRRLIEKHTTIAADMLAPLWPGGGWPIEAATQHHERGDGTGYPLGMKMLEVSSFVHLLAACDVYAAMCAPRPHRPAHDTRTALTEILVLSEREFLDKNAAERLLGLSFYPAGSVVELNDGSIAVVSGAHAGALGLANPARPVVHLIADAQGGPLAWPTTIDLLDDTHHSIVRSLDAEERKSWLGKKYPQLV